MNSTAMRDGVRIEALRVSARAEAAALIKRVGGDSDGPVKERVARAADKLGWSYNRTEDIWREEASRIESWEMDALREAVRGTT